MDKNSAKFFAAQIGAVIPTVDLHGFYPSEALEKLDIFIYQCVERNSDSARVVYGAGTGKLREAVLDFLKRHKTVVDYKDEGVSCIILF